MPEGSPVAPAAAARHLAEDPGSRSAFAEALGGRRGIVDSGLPTAVFVIVNILAAVRPAVFAAVGTGLAIVVLRLLRRQTVQQAVSGLFGLALAALLAVYFRGGDGTGFFLPTVVFSAAYALAFLVSLLVGKPLVGVIASSVEGRGSGWRDDPVLYRAYAMTTAGWAVLFAVKAAVQGVLLAVGTSVTWLGVVKLAMGYPLTLGAVGLTLLWVRRAGRRAAARADRVASS